MIAEQFYSMPFPLKVIFLAGLSSPAITIGSVLTGTVLPPDASSFAYGAARNLIELIFVTVTSIPASVIAVFMFMRRKVSLLLFPFGYSAVCLAPIFLSTVRENVDYMMSSVLSALVIGAIASAYLFLSGGVRRYFEQS